MPIGSRYPAMLYETRADGSVRCRLCGHHCVIAPGKRGVCNVRENREGVLEALTYGKVLSRHVDPVEKKPLYHFHPGSTAYSIATAGCNFRCPWCQNWEIAHVPPVHGQTPVPRVAPDAIVSEAGQAGCRSIAYTYTEPTVFFEYALDVARLAHGAGIANVFVTNGYMSGEALELLQGVLDAANVDLKAFRDETYRTVIGARLQPVLDNVRAMKRAGVWVEVTTLVIPDLNDSRKELRDIADFIAGDLGPETPWHVSRFHPTHRMTDRPATPAASIRAARDTGLEAGLKHVYLGNAALPEGGNTQCAACGEVLIERNGFAVRANRVRGGRCPSCGAAVAGVGMDGP